MKIKVPQRHQLQPDETLFSFIARIHRLSGAWNEKYTYQLIAGTDRIRIHPYLPSSLEKISLAIGIDKDRLLVRHTLYSFFQMFAQATSSGLRAAMMDDNGCCVNAQAHIPHAKLNLYCGQKFCPQCVSEDVHRIGYSYFRVWQQIPGIEACYQHGCYMVGIDAGDGGYDRHCVLPSKHIKPTPAPAKAVTLAKFSFDVWKLSKLSSETIDYQQAYQEELKKKNLLTTCNHLRLKALLIRLADYYQGYPFNAGLGIPTKLDSFKFIGPLLRHNNHCPCHPLKNLLFSCCLFDGDASLFIPSFSKQQVLEKPHYESRYCEKDVLNLLRQGLSMNKIELKTGASRCYIRRVADLNGIQHRTNANAYSLKLKRHVWIKAFHGQHRETIAKDMCVGVGYVEQVISNTPGLTAWRKYLRHQRKLIEAIETLRSVFRDNPDWTRTQIRMHSQAAYMHIYLHDKSLLEELLPPKIKPVPPGKNWANEDARLFKEISKMSDKLNLSLSAIGRRVNDHGFLLKRLDRLHKTKALLKGLGLV